MELTDLDRLFWAAGFAGHLLLLSTLFLTKRMSRFPIFTAYIAFLVVKTISLWYLQRFGSSVYFYFYWSFSFADTLLELLVIGEVVRVIFRPSGNLSLDVKKPLICIASCSAAVATLIAVLASPPVDRIEVSIVLRGELFSTVMISELFVGLLIISVTFGFIWSTHVGVIVRGLGVFSMLSLVSQGLEGFLGTHHGLDLFKTLSQLQIVAYLACLTYWIVGLSQPAPETRPLPENMRVLLVRLNTHIAALSSELRVGKGAS